jgi:hypothetical protein
MNITSDASRAVELQRAEEETIWAVASTVRAWMVKMPCAASSVHGLEERA